MRRALAVLALLAVGGLILYVVSDEPPDDGVFHPDYTRVFNEFQTSVSALVGQVSSVPQDSECKRVADARWRCYRRWAPPGQPNEARIFEADVNVYQERVVVGEVSRVRDSAALGAE
jgi:hypothetical protein